MQQFVSEKHLGKIPFDDFSGRTEEELFEYIKEQNSKPLSIFKGEIFRIRFFRSPDGKFGIYGTFSHLALDTIAIFIFYKDLLEVYSALKNGTELPKPLSSYEELLPKDYSLNDKAKLKKNSDFYGEYFSEHGESFYAGPDQMRDLERTRKFLHSPNFRGAPIIHPFNDNSTTAACHIDSEIIEKMEKFCNEQKIPLQSLFLLGMRTHLSKVNALTDDVSFFITVGRRSTLADRNSGGSRVLAHILRTVIEKETTFSEALSLVGQTQMKLFRHADYSSLREMFKIAATDKRFVYFTSVPMLFTFFPREAVTLPENMKVRFFGLGTGHFVYSQYTMIMPNFFDGGYDCYYEYQTRSINEDDVLLMHKNIVKSILAGIENPERTIGDILENVL
jgi:hypothetical protein